MTAFKIADRWFERKSIDNDITHIWEPHIHPLLRCNIWFVRGRDKHMLIDTGMGMGSLKDDIQDLADKDVTAVATHFHFDHVGCLHEFDERIIHPIEAPRMTDYQEWMPIRLPDFGLESANALPSELAALEFDFVEDYLINAVHTAGFDLDSMKITSTSATRTVDEGDVIDIGDRHFEVMHLPGHSPGSIGLWEESTGIFFSGDAIYDGPMTDELPESDVSQYIQTMKRLRELPVQIVHGGHMESFGRERLIELADAYLAHRDC